MEEAPWHSKFNDGLLPILEQPNGLMTDEIKDIIQFAKVQAKNKEVQPLIPKDIQMKRIMRQKVEYFDQLTTIFYEIWESRGRNKALIARFNNDLVKHDELAFDSGGKFLMGTSEPTLLDFHVAPFWELLHFF